MVVMSELIFRGVIRTEMHELVRVCLIVVRPVEPPVFALQLPVWDWNKLL